MKRNMQALIAIVIGLGIIVGGFAGVIYLATPLSSQETREIWTPEHFHIANKLDGSHIIVSGYKNDKATQMSFEELRKDYDTSYSDENFEIVVQQNGTVWYAWSFHGVSFKASQRNWLTGFPRTGSVTEVSRDGQKAYITIVYVIDAFGGVILFLICVGAVALGVSLGWFFYPENS